tara:strand:- start:6932 stop:7333 length:402 start_codon:yes stop_codon:yes gene_type:complete
MKLTIEKLSQAQRDTIEAFAVAVTTGSIKNVSGRLKRTDEFEVKNSGAFWADLEYRFTPPTEENYRAWTSYEAIGQTVTSPHTGDTYVVTSYSNETGLFILGADLEMSPTDLLEYFEMLDGSPCGVLVAGGEA